MKHKAEAILATATSAGSWVVNTHEALQLAISVLTLLWWIRIWATRDKTKKPKDPTE